MSKRIFISIVLLTLGLSAFCQPRLEQPEYYLGVQGGVMASMVQFSPEVTQDPLKPYWGANAGLVFRYAGHKYCGLQVELNWMQRGWNETDVYYLRTLHYIEIPFLFHLYFGKKVRGFINLGPQIGYCFAEKGNNTSFSNDMEQKEQYYSIDNAFDWGVAAGLGIVGRSKAGAWQLEARFNYSLGDIYSNSKADHFARSAPMNLSVNFGWLWEFKRHGM